MTTTQGRGGGGHGGGHGGHGHGFGYPGVYYDPWVFYDMRGEDAECKDAHKRHVVGEGELSTGTGAALVLAVLAWLILEADKRVPR